MDSRRRRELTRFGAPAAFLAAVTIAVVLIKAGLSGSDAQPTTSSAARTAPTTTRQRVTTRLVLTAPTPAATTTPGAEYYVVQSGDTLGAIALEYDTTVEELVRLNPDVDPTALHIGERIRVG